LRRAAPPGSRSKSDSWTSSARPSRPRSPLTGWADDRDAPRASRLTWLRWRLLKNSLSGSHRDSVEQASRAGADGAVDDRRLSGGLSGRQCARLFRRPLMPRAFSRPGRLLVFRLLLGIMAFTIVALSIMSPTQSTLSRSTRLLLLPIHRRVLHLVSALEPRRSVDRRRRGQFDDVFDRVVRAAGRGSRWWRSPPRPMVGVVISPDHSPVSSWRG
jgi:hypothetical protein